MPGVQQGVMGLNTHGHGPLDTIFYYLAKAEFGDGIAISEVFRMSYAGEVQPGNHGAMYHVVTTGIGPQVVCLPGGLQRGGGLLYKGCNILKILYKSKAKGAVGPGSGAEDVNFIIQYNVVVFQAQAESFQAVDGPQRGVEIRQKNRMITSLCTLS